MTPMKPRTHDLASPTGGSTALPSVRSTRRPAGLPPGRPQPQNQGSGGQGSGGQGFLILLCILLAMGLGLIVAVFYAIL